MNKYDEIMENINVSEEMKQRVLQNVSDCLDGENKKKNYGFISKYKKIISLAACFMLVFAIAVVPSLMQSGDSTIKNPTLTVPTYEVFETLEEMQTKSGFEIGEIKYFSADEYSSTYVLYNSQIAQIQYASDTTTATYRKAAVNENISGNYYAYDYEETLTLNNVVITIKGNDQGGSHAIWFDGEYTHSITINKTTTEPISWEQIGREELIVVINQII